jgi:fatty acid desaturase
MRGTGRRRLPVVDGTSPVLALDRNGYAELAGEIRRLGLLESRPGYHVAATAAALAALAALVTVTALMRNSWWLMLVAVAFAVVFAQIGFLAHDAGHRQVSHRARTSRLLGLVHANLLTGLSFGWWVHKHNAHHAHPNHVGADPDVEPGVLVFDAEHAQTRRGLAGWVTRRQAWLFFPLLLLEAWNIHLTSIRAVLRPGLPHRRTEAALLTVHWGAYAALLATTMTLPQALVFVLVHQGVLGLYLGCAFAPNHKGMPILTAEQSADPLLRQVLTSRNIRGGPVVDFVLGGLNYQIEHHLFPSMPRPNLRRAQRIVRPFCAENSVTYTETTLRRSYGIVIRHLNQVGLRAADPFQCPLVTALRPRT